MKRSDNLVHCLNVVYELDWLDRQALQFLIKVADTDGFIYHPRGHSVSEMIAWAVECHSTYAHRIVKMLLAHGFVEKLPHPKTHRSPGSRGYCLFLKFSFEVLEHPEIQSVLNTWPPGHKWHDVSSVFYA